jgi:hypothetical protein
MLRQQDQMGWNYTVINLSMQTVQHVGSMWARLHSMHTVLLPAHDLAAVINITASQACVCCMFSEFRVASHRRTMAYRTTAAIDDCILPDRLVLDAACLARMLTAMCILVPHVPTTMLIH